MQGSAVYAIIKEAMAQEMLTDEDSMESAMESRAGFHYEEFEFEELLAYKLFAHELGQAYKHMNLARLLNLRWIVHLQDVVRTPHSLILIRPCYETTLGQLFQQDCGSLIVARVILYLANAIMYLQNFGITHRDIRPSKVLVEREPKLRVWLYGFNLSSSYLDQDIFPPVKATDYNPPGVGWPSGSKKWDLYSLSMIIYEWHLRKIKAIPS
jgi:serine/threonine protein kinase